MFAKVALDAAGRVQGYQGAVTNADFIAAQAYLMDSACVSTASVDASDTYNAGFRYASTGALRIYDATSAVPAGSNTNQGVKLTSDGQLCITTDAISTDVAYINGMAVDSAGRVFMTLLNPAAWFRFAQGITEAGQGVSQWADQSGNSRHLKQGTDGARPAKQSDGSILFNGTDEYLKCDAFTLNQPISYYLLWKQVSWTDDDDLFDGNSLASVLLQQRSSSPSVDIYAGSATAAANVSWGIDTYAAMAIVVNGASSLIQVNAGTPSTGNPGSANAGGFTLAANGTGSGNSHIQSKEVIIFPAAHDANTRLHTIRYLQRVGALWP